MNINANLWILLTMTCGSRTRLDFGHGLQSSLGSFALEPEESSRPSVEYLRTP
jgi:hypothetical protein